MAKSGSPVFLSLCFFAMLVTLGLGCQFTLVETIVVTPCEVFNIRGKERLLLLVCLSVVLFLLGLSMTTPGGSYVLTLLDNYALSWNVIIQSLLVCSSIAIYGKILLLRLLRAFQFLFSGACHNVLW